MTKSYLTLLTRRRRFGNGGSGGSLDGGGAPSAYCRARGSCQTRGRSVRALATEQTDAQIADTLNGRWPRTGAGLPFSRLRVRMLREAYDINSYQYAEHLIKARWLTVPQMAELLDVHPAIAKRFAHQGVLRAVRADDKGTLLFEPPTGPLPVAHPGKRLRDRRRYPKPVSHVQEGA